jgi:uncharacterized protein YaiL (DUF2058 family)
MNFLRHAGLAGAAFVVAACASTPPPTAQMAVSAAAVSRAAGAGAPAGAPVEMSTARDKMAQANLAMSNKDYDKARMLALEAQNDAQLAEAKTETAKANKAAAEMQESTRVLSEELARKARSPQ